MNTFNLNQMILIEKVKNFVNPNAPFYASDYGFSGSDMQSLSYTGIIRPTGNTREVMVEIGDNLYKKVTAKEWVVSEMQWWYKDTYKKTWEKIGELLELVNLHSL